MTTPSELAIDHQMAAEDDRDTREHMPDPAAGTEELRVTLQRYRAFGTRLADFSRET
jgi:hypothetical protein